MKRPNIIFVLLDGARYDRLHTSPEFQELQKDGVLLDNVTAAMPYTFGAINVIFTGLFGKENGVNGYYKVLKLRDDVSVLPEILQKAGYFTSRALITDQVLSPRGYDLRASYDEYKEDISARHIELLKTTFEQAGDRPIFSFLQFSRIHTVTVSEILKKYEWDDSRFYENKQKNLEKFDEVFKEASTYAMKIKNSINEWGKLDNTIIVYFTDHGTGIGERFGERNYGSFTFEETVRTFYLFVGLDITKNKKYSNLISTIDILPTILDLCKINNNLKIPGRSFSRYLLNDLDEPFGREITFAETGALHGLYPSPEESNIFCAKSNTHKIIYNKTTDKWELYDLIKDKGEIRNLFGAGLPIETNLKDKLLRWINR
jgi:arylsulfatase A-like enzyme